MPEPKYLSRLEQYIQHHDQSHSTVSRKGVDWHMDHMLKVINGTCHMIKKSDPKEYRWKFNLIRLLILTFQYIPRGRARAPKVVTSQEIVPKEALIDQFRSAKQALLEIENLPPKSSFKHPYFGLINLKTTKRFLKAHTNHHLKIVRDIVNKS